MPNHANMNELHSMLCPRNVFRIPAKIKFNFAFWLFLCASISVGWPAPQPAAPVVVTGQWDFKFDDLRATVGADLQYVGNTSNLT